jgi:hypothetical protein
MCSKNLAWKMPREISEVHGYPIPSDSRPIYMFGTFDPCWMAAKSSRVAVDALLGIQENASAAVMVHAHSHAKVTAEGSRAFMFGGDPGRSPAAAPDEPSCYFWDV